MRAFVIDRIDDRGRVAEVPEPEVAAGEVLIRVRAVGLVASDWRVRAGSRLGRQEHVFPAVMGFDFAGEIVAVPEGDHGWTVGERVFGIAHKPFIGAGALAELLAMPADGPIAPTPAHLTDVQAAALVSAWVTSLATFDVTPLAAGDSVLLLGASGGVGSVLTQLLARRGVEVVAISRAANTGYVRGLGAAGVIPYDEVDVVTAARSLKPAGFTALIDLMSDPERFDELATLVAPGGLAVSGVRAADAERMAGLGIRVANIAGLPRPERLAELDERWTAEGLVLPVIEVVDLGTSAAAIDRVQEGHVRGRIVVAMP